MNPHPTTSACADVVGWGFARSEGVDVNRARLVAVSRTRWRLDMPLHTGRWQPTPYVGSMIDMFRLLTTELGPWIGPLD